MEDSGDETLYTRLFALEETQNKANRNVVYGRKKG